MDTNNSSKPLISVVAPAYNCECFIDDFIKSFLAQTYDNFELIIVDDCSSDNTADKIKKYDDERISFFQHEWNKGVNFVLNTGFRNAKGKYIAFVSCDDYVKPTYLENAMHAFQRNESAGVVYTSLILVDEQGKVFKNQPKWAMQKNLTREELLKFMFYEGNALLSPGMMFKKDVITDLIPLDISLTSYQDYFIHVNLLITHDLAILSEPEYFYRRSRSSLSARKDSSFRDNLEIPKLMDSFLRITDLALLKKVLQNDSIDIKHYELIPYYIGISALNSKHHERQKWGYRTIMHFISDSSNYELLHRLIGFSYARLLNIAKTLYIEHREKSKYKRRKRLIIILSFLFCIVAAIGVLSWIID